MSWLRRHRAQPQPEAELPDLPTANTWVQLRIGDDVVDARVDEMVDGTALLAELRSTELAAGQRLIVVWTQSDGLVQLDATVESVEAQTARAHIRIEGLGEHLQRRRFVRVPASLRVTLRQPDGVVLRTATADMSETGMRCMVRGDVVPTPGMRLAVTLMLDDEPINLAADVRRVRTAGGRGHEVALHFVEPYPRDPIGRWLMAAQLRLRAKDRS